MLSIRLLGPPELTLDAQPLNITRRKSRALVYYLAAHDKPVTREHLLSLLWIDLERPAAQQTLRTTLHGLRKQLGDALHVESDQITLSADTFIDVRLFESQLAHPGDDSAALEDTLNLYRSDFLSDFILPAGDAFGTWVEVQREHYRRLAIRGWTRLSQLHEARKDYAAAIDVLERALILDPLQEDLQRDALRLSYLSGDRTGAIRRYESLRKLLDEELGVPPMAETRALYDAIINDTLAASTLQLPTSKLQALISNAQSPTSNIQPLPFIGRHNELQKLYDPGSLHRLVLIEGEPGIGKTRLAHEFIQTLIITAEQNNAPAPLLLGGSARELEQVLPYQPIIEALRNLSTRSDWPEMLDALDLPDIWLSEVARLLPEVLDRPADPRAPDESRLWEGVHQFLYALAQHHPLVLLLDDLHWADTSTLGFLGYTIRRLNSDSSMRDRPIYFLSTTRSAPPLSALATLLQTLARENCLMRIALDRLARDEVLTLAQTLSTHYAYPLNEWLMRNSEGNPYVLLELVRHARENNILHPDGTVDLNQLSTSPVVPRSVYDLIQVRLAHLSEAARRVIEAAIVVGRTFDFEVVARAVALSENAVLDAIDELRSAGFIAPLGHESLRFGFEHTLIMEVVYLEGGEPRHRMLHRRVAEALAGIYHQQPDEAAGLIAFHFQEGLSPQRAAPFAYRAAQRATQLAAWSEAIAFYQQALAHPDHRQHVAITLALANVHLQAAHFTQARDTFAQALRLAEEMPDSPGADPDAIQLQLGQSLVGLASYTELFELAQRLRQQTTRVEIAARAEILIGVALSTESNDLDAAAEHLHNAESLLKQSDVKTHSGELEQIKFELGSIAAQQGDLTKAVELYRDVLDMASHNIAPASLPLHILAYNNLAYHLHLSRDPDAATYAHKGLDLAQASGALGLQPYLLSTLGEIELANDNLRTAEEYFNAGLTLAQRLEMPERVAGLSANLGLLARQRNDPALALRLLSTAMQQADALGTKHLAAQIRIWLAALLPRAEARTRLAEARAMAESGGRRRLLEEIAHVEQQLAANSPE